MADAGGGCGGTGRDARPRGCGGGGYDDADYVVADDDAIRYPGIADDVVRGNPDGYAGLNGRVDTAVTGCVGIAVVGCGQGSLAQHGDKCE